MGKTNWFDCAKKKCELKVDENNFMVKFLLFLCTIYCICYAKFKLSLHWFWLTLHVPDCLGNHMFRPLNHFQHFYDYVRVMRKFTLKGRKERIHPIDILTHGLVTPYGVRVLVKVSSGNGLLPDGTKPLPEPMLTYHQLRSSYNHPRAILQEIPQPLITKRAWQLLT